MRAREQRGGTKEADAAGWTGAAERLSSQPSQTSPASDPSSVRNGASIAVAASRRGDRPYPFRPVSRGSGRASSFRPGPNSSGPTCQACDKRVHAPTAIRKTAARRRPPSRPSPTLRWATAVRWPCLERKGSARRRPSSARRARGFAAHTATAVLVSEVRAHVNKQNLCR